MCETALPHAHTKTPEKNVHVCMNIYAKNNNTKKKKKTQQKKIQVKKEQKQMGIFHFFFSFF